MTGSHPHPSHLKYLWRRCAHIRLLCVTVFYVSRRVRNAITPSTFFYEIRDRDYCAARCGCGIASARASSHHIHSTNYKVFANTVKNILLQSDIVPPTVYCTANEFIHITLWLLNNG